MATKTAAGPMQTKLVDVLLNSEDADSFFLQAFKDQLGSDMYDRVFIMLEDKLNNMMNTWIDKNKKLFNQLLTEAIMKELPQMIKDMVSNASITW